ncbi:hypothetical protein MJT46_004253, partial [Ovis ammon polii x Ovis aries]
KSYYTKKIQDPNLEAQLKGSYPQRNPSLQDLLTPPEEKQRWSVQSDQGYISRSSPQPPDNDNGEGVREEDEGQPLSSQGLESLRSLQLLLFS